MKKVFVVGFVAIVMALGCGGSPENEPFGNAEHPGTIAPPPAHQALLPSGIQVSHPAAPALDPCLTPTASQISAAKWQLGWWGQHDGVPDPSRGFTGMPFAGYPRAEDFDPLRTGPSNYTDMRFMAALAAFQAWADHGVAADGRQFVPPGVQFPIGVAADWLGKSCGAGFLEPASRKSLDYYVYTFTPWW